jgi:hypothetical protein
MKGLSSLERVVLESIGKEVLGYEEIKNQAGLMENVFHNVLQALIIRGLVAMDGTKYRIAEKISPLMIAEINGKHAKEAEYLELIEAMIHQKTKKNFHLQKVAMDSKDEKIFGALLYNLESFLADAHKKSVKSISIKERKVIFWGISDVESLMTQIVEGN